MKSEMLNDFFEGMKKMPKVGIGEGEQFRLDVNRCEHALGKNADFLTRWDDSAPEQHKLWDIQEFFKSLPGENQARIVETLMTQTAMASVIKYCATIVGNHDTLKIRSSTDEQNNVLVNLSIKYTNLKYLFCVDLGVEQDVSEDESIRAAYYDANFKVSPNASWHVDTNKKSGEKRARWKGVQMMKSSFWVERN